MTTEGLKGQATRTEPASATTFHTRYKPLIPRSQELKTICRRLRRRGERRRIQGRTKRTR